MEIKQLQHFVAICEYKSFGKAAKHCFISVQGISVSIGRLEEELECKLFERTVSGAELTNAGEYLLPKAKEILKQVAQCKEYYSKRRLQKILSIMLIRGTVEKVARPCIKQFMEQFPDAQLDFRVGSDADCIASVENGTVDFAICSGPFSEDIKSLSIYKAPAVVAVRNDCAIANKKQIGIKDLKDYNVALLDEGSATTRELFRLADLHNIHLGYTFVDDPRMAMYMVDLAGCVGIINPVSASKLQLNNISLRPLNEKELMWDISLIRLSEKEMTKEALAFEKIVKDYSTINF